MSFTNKVKNKEEGSNSQIKKKESQILKTIWIWVNINGNEK